MKLVAVLFIGILLGFLLFLTLTILVSDFFVFFFFPWMVSVMLTFAYYDYKRQWKVKETN